jgi:PPM family protein phosphatase
MVVPDSHYRLHWRSYGVTDRGRRRRRNEDALLLTPEAGVYAVADGMGGHAAGDVASRMAVHTLSRVFGAVQPPSTEAAAAWLSAGFAAANEAILAHAAGDRACAGMGTTLTALAVPADHGGIAIAHTGDSRAYRLRGGELAQLTRDHTWVQQQVDAGILTPAAARHHARSSVLYRVLGIESAEAADIIIADAAAGDVLLLCSDGLTAMLEDEHIRATVQGAVGQSGPGAALDLSQLGTALVAEANRRGGVDNITLVLLQALAGDTADT